MKNDFCKTTIAMASVMLLAALLGGCATTNSSTSASDNTKHQIVAIGAENEYADVISQIGGKYVSVTGIMSNPETDPHTYEANTKDAALVGKATLVVENGLGYDDFMDKLISGSPNTGRTVVNVAKELGYSDDTQNPHLWYHPETMPKVAELVAQSLEKQMPSQKQVFEDNLSKFKASLSPWANEIASLKQANSGAAVAVTEPVSDYLLEAAGLENKTPWAYQAAVMNGTDPAPQDVKTQQELFTNKTVKVFLYNRQAVDDSTKALLTLAKKNNIPIVGVYETMPTHYTYQKWMEAETKAIQNAIENGVSTEELK